MIPENVLLHGLHQEKALIDSFVSHCSLMGNDLPLAMNGSVSLRNGLRVLVVDSDRDSRDLLTILFAEYGIETITATCTSEAIARIHQAPPDLLISEIFLPDEDGYSLIRHVKNLETTFHVQIPAIALTTMFAGEHDRICSLAAGFCKHLLKPLDVDELIATVACLIERAQSIAANSCKQKF